MNYRKRRKRSALLLKQAEIIVPRYQDPEPGWEGAAIRAAQADMAEERPYETIAQARHDRRVFGHEIESCTETHDPDELSALVLWNQPPPLWSGTGHAYHRRAIRRRKR